MELAVHICCIMLLIGIANESLTTQQWNISISKYIIINILNINIHVLHACMYAKLQLMLYYKPSV